MTIASEFVTRSLKMPLLKNHLLIHVDCTHLKMDFRNGLFMGSRDRLKDAGEYRELRKQLTEVLLKSKLPGYLQAPQGFDHPGRIDHQRIAEVFQPIPAEE
jgi:hypothetical protein